MNAEFKQKEFSDAVTDKMFAEMSQKKKRIGVREFGREMNISGATFSRISRGYPPDLLTYAKICKWLGKELNEYILLT